MNKSEFLEAVTQIGSCEDDVERRTLLADLSENVSNVFDSNESLTADNEKYLADNEKLRQANMNLFLKVGEQKTPEQIVQSQTGVQTPTERKSFTNLFDERGNLK